jgi:glycosyltransferase involved in cell wall biosynthesis
MLAGVSAAARGTALGFDLRFCLVSTFYPPDSFGGDGVHVRALAEMLAREGHEVEVVHCRDSFRWLAADKRNAAGEQASMIPGVRVHCLESGFGLLSPAATFLTGHPNFKRKKIESILARGRFDVIHFHNISLVGGPAILGLGDGIKLLTLHEHWLVCPTHTLFKYNKRACDGRECLRCAVRSGRPPQWWRYTNLVQRSLDQVDAVLCPSRSVQIKHEEGGLRARFVAMPSFAPRLEPPPRNSQAQRSLGGECLPAVRAPRNVPFGEEDSSGDAAWPRPYFLFVGRLEKLKGLQDVIPAFRDRVDADLVIAGTGSYESVLRIQAAGRERVHFLGYAGPARLARLYQGAVGVVVPALTFEVAPLVILEALAQRAPVVVRDLGPLPEMVRESGGGLIFRTQEELVSSLEKLLADRGLRDRLGTVGHDYSQKEWSELAYQQRYFGLIETLRRERGLRT